MRKQVLAMMTVLLATVMMIGCTEPEVKTFRLLHWNIQNGMWDGQNDNYDRFVEFVKSKDPDVCVWCEAQSIWKTDSDQPLDKADRYLVEHWGELAARYGHSYWGIGGYRDSYPQVITSKYPIQYVAKIVGDENIIVSHGAGWATIEVEGKTVNIVTLHTWPHAYAYRAEDREASKAEQGGDKYRAKEIQYICENTIGKVPEAENQLWMMMGDFNSRSRVDNEVYGYADNDPKLLVHDYIKANTPYIDVIKEKYPNVIPTPAGSELALVKAAESGLISYLSGEDHFEILKPEELSEAQKKGLEYIQTNILDVYGSTGVQDALNYAIFELLERIVVYPVQDENKYTDQKGNVLPDGFLVPKGSTPKELAYIVHTDIGDKFMHAVDARKKMRVASDYELQDGDIISIITRQ